MLANTTTKISTDKLIDMVSAMNKQTGQFRTFRIGMLSVVYDTKNNTVMFYIDNGLDNFQIDESQILNIKTVKSILKEKVI